MKKTRRERTRTGLPAQPGVPIAEAASSFGGGRQGRQSPERARRLGVSLALLVLSLALYAPVRHHDLSLSTTPTT